MKEEIKFYKIINFPDLKLENPSQNMKNKNISSLNQCSSSSNNSITITIPVRIYSEANIQQHWAIKHRRKKIIQKAIRYIWNSCSIRNVKLPVTITLTRLAPRTLDDDNLVASFKSARDVVADLLIPGLAPGRADDNPKIKFLYDQMKSKEYSFKIQAQEN